MNILGISAFYHDSAAALIRDGNIIAAAQEERFTRIKHDSEFPFNAVEYCLKEANISPANLDIVVFYDKPLLKFERILQTYLAFAPKGISSFYHSVPLWLREKLWTKAEIAEVLEGFEGEILFTEHHQSHAASAFYPSPFQEAAILTIDGVGEWATSSYGYGKDNKITLIKELRFPHSVGLLYSAFTYFTGFKVNSGEYKLMGLAPYGEPKYVDLILKELVDIKEDGSISLNLKYFNYPVGLTMTNNAFNELFEGKPRKSESPVTQKDMDLARSIQDVTEIIMLNMARYIKKETSMDYLVLAGGVALNCVGNGVILRERIFKDLWIQPAAGDAGGALGAALAVWYEYLDNPRKASIEEDMQMGSFLGPAFSDDEIETWLKENKYPYRKFTRDEIIEKVADLLGNEKVIGFFQGRMEFGPRALGSRSIIGDARSRQMQKVLNLKIKFRESFRPFAPSVLEEYIGDYFEIDRPSPYMLLVAFVNENLRVEMTEKEKKLFGIDKLNVPRSSIPAITHVDYSARIQSVSRKTNPFYYDLINSFKDKTGCAVIINTSFNVRGEPIVHSPKDAYTCFMRTEMDYLVMENFLLDKTQQPVFKEEFDWRERIKLD
ncbi:MAG: carbamoyltransferase [Candidatus Coatesbacteria bacterium]|nr:carbamoyltransferase [Candidatus Coatesbacteria bacterium]